MLSAAEFNRVIDERAADWLAAGAAVASGSPGAPAAGAQAFVGGGATAPDDARALCDRLFGAGRHRIAVDGDFVAGEAELDGRRVRVIGSWNRVAVDVSLALRIAGAVLDAVAADAGGADAARADPPPPIVFIASTSGQALSRRDELLGVNGFFAHIARCVDLARRRGHRTLALVHGEAVSGGFLAFGLLADRTVALPGAQVRVMDLRAMSRVTKIPLDDLQAFARSSPVFAPGADNYERMGAIREVWPEDGWPARLAEALAADDGHASDERARLGAERGGRRLAAEVAARVAGSGPAARLPAGPGAVPVGAAA
nr:biotin-independent malonate decarboxylase subunit gamma [Derxia gummosa]